MDPGPTVIASTALVVVPIVVGLVVLGIAMVLVTRWLVRETEQHHPALVSLDELGRVHRRRRHAGSQPVDESPSVALDTEATVDGSTTSGGAATVAEPAADAASAEVAAPSRRGSGGGGH